MLLIRHGESAAVREGEPPPEVDGQDDPSLHPEGRLQADLLADRLQHEQIDAIYVSSLARTQETAAPLAERLGLTPIVVPELREVFLGDWERGAFRKYVADDHPIARAVIEQQRWDVIPNAEPGQAFAERLRGAVAEIVAKHPDQRVAVVVHGGVIGEVLRQAADAGQRFAFVGADHASISEVVIDGRRWIIRRYNDTAHLGVRPLDPVPSMPREVKARNGRT